MSAQNRNNTNSETNSSESFKYIDEISGNEYIIRPDVINYDDVITAVPKLAKHPHLVRGALKMIGMDKVNHVHGKYCHTPGVPFARCLKEEEYHWDVRVDNFDVLKQFPTGPFITVSNHPFGSYDGILLIDTVGQVRPDFKVMVNLILNKINAMQPSFIAVDPLKSEDHEKKKITMQGIRAAIKHVKEGHPLGFFPAGAISKFDRHLRIRDREWQPMIIRLIRQLQVPVIPIFFHGHNSLFFNILGVIDWRLRTLRLPNELFSTYNKRIHITVGNPISVEEQQKYSTLEELGRFLKEQTYALAKVK